MPTTGTPGWLALVASFAFIVTRAVKGDAANAFLKTMGMPPIPPVALPWVALAASFIGVAATSAMGGASWPDAALAGLWGLLGGGVGIGAHEALEKPVRAIAGDAVGNLAFGRRPAPAPADATPKPVSYTTTPQTPEHK